MFNRVTVFAYGVFSYALSLVVFAYAAGFLGNIGVPKSIDSPRAGSLAVALFVDLGLLVLFALQHSVMARPTFKQWWTRIIPPAAERSTYVLLSNVCLILLFWLWRPIGGELWTITNPVGSALLWILYLAGWAVVFSSTMLIHHFDLFGMRQAWLHLRGKEYTALPFQTPALYRFVRHPLYVGWFMVFWFTPTMTITHLVFAIGTTAYILVAIPFEERNLIEHHGQVYADYRRRVPRFVPRLSAERQSTPKDAAVAVPGLLSANAD